MEGSSLIKSDNKTCVSQRESESGGPGAVSRAGVKGGRCGSGFPSLSVYRVWQGRSCQRVRSPAKRGPTFWATTSCDTATNALWSWLYTGLQNQGFSLWRWGLFLSLSLVSPQQPSFVSGRCRLSLRALCCAQVTQNSKDSLIYGRFWCENQTWHLWEIFCRSRHHQKSSIYILVGRLRDWNKRLWVWIKSYWGQWLWLLILFNSMKLTK